MKKQDLQKLLLMGFISGEIWWFSTVFILNLSNLLHEIAVKIPGSFYRFFNFLPWSSRLASIIILHGVLGMVLAMFFPLWQKYLKNIKIQSFLLQSITLWLVVPTVLVTVKNAILFGPAVVFKEPVFQPNNLIIGELTAGFCFYLIGKLLRFTNKR